LKVQAVKYLFKYIYKGPDKAQTTFEPILTEKSNEATQNVDEIKDYVDARYISAIEGVWHIFHFLMHEQGPSVIRLDTHLENENTIVFLDDDKIDDIKNKSKNTKLTAWFLLNQNDPEAHQYLYHDIPKYYVWKNDKRMWQKRKHNKTSDMIGRMYFIKPADTERFSLRILLLHATGCKSFQELCTFEHIVYPTYQACAIARGLLQSDDTWHDTLHEASNFTTDIRKLRLLFVTILIYGNPSNPGDLWSKHRDSLTLDILFNEKTRLNDQNISFNHDMYDLSLYYISEILATYNKKLKDFAGMPLLNPNYNPNDTLLNNFELNRFIRAETEYNREVLIEYVQIAVAKLNPEQFEIYNQIIYNTKPTGKSGNLYFVDGPGGTGKTFLYNTILAKKRAEGKIALAVATSGIAANLLDGGKTAHSVFRIPLQIYNDSSCRIETNSDLAAMIRKCDCVIWDEAVMAHKYIFTAVERVIRDIMSVDNPKLNDIPFGDKQILFGGDFRQILPVVKKGNRSAIVNASIKFAPFCSQVTIFKLKTNMRIISAALNLGVDVDKLNEFSNFLLNIGEGKVPPLTNCKYTDEIQLPRTIAHNMDELELIKAIYPDIEKNSLDGEFMSTRAILAGKNRDVNNINQIGTEYFPGISKVYLSADSCNNEIHQNTYPTEFLNKIIDSSLPLHKLELKLNQPIILIRNISQAEGLCNGTRLIIRSMHRTFLDCEIAIGKNKGKRYFIPKFGISPSDSESPINIKRVQFPIRAAFAMTINKSQGATLKKVGLFLNDPVFSHGQLYVALSRVASLSDIVLATNSTIEGVTRNVVYHEIFTNRN
jgi:hypothetical protein